ncbi:MAG: hypothetical protein AAGJ70_11530, partial [Pseudomonadota bacterium]
VFLLGRALSTGDAPARLEGRLVKYDKQAPGLLDQDAAALACAPVLALPVVARPASSSKKPGG